jgi:protein SCO1/2
MNATSPEVVSRRSCLALCAGLALTRWTHAAHGDLGRLDPPLVPPYLSLTLHDGRQTTLQALLKGRITALQLMFTTCSATCPIQGATFAALQDHVGARVPRGQLLSVSIDPLGDDAKALSAWRAKFAAKPHWLAAVPAVRSSDVMLDFVAGRAKGADRHTAQTYLFDSDGRFIYRLAEFASARDISAVMEQISRAT